MSQAKKPFGVPVFVESIEHSDTLPICPICGAAIRYGLRLHCSKKNGVPLVVHVCRPHLPPTLLMQLDPALAAIAGNNAIIEMNTRRPLVRKPGERPPLWRPATRSKIVSAPASDTGQEAPAVGSRLSLAGLRIPAHLDRALGLLAELVGRIFNAGVGCNRDRRESEAPVK